MSDSLLIFSIGPVQAFIAEARRAQDLWAGSHWLSDIVRAAILACTKLDGTELIYPVDPAQPSLPNKFVLLVPEASVDDAVQAAKDAAQRELDRRAKLARDFLRRVGPPTDKRWKDTWKRQTKNHLQFFWAAARWQANYKAAYAQANAAFGATKRVRVFAASEEIGRKDSLSGRRSALCTGELDARQYWTKVAESEAVTPSRLRPDGRERLDSLGATKRFGFLDAPEARAVPSVSSVASTDFLLGATATAQEALKTYREVLERIPKFHKVSSDRNWPYDGGLLYLETLEPERLRDSYGFDDNDLQVRKGDLKDARSALGSLYHLAGRPDSYYAVLAMDGDSMGTRVCTCETQGEHSELSRQLVDFSTEAKRIVEDTEQTGVGHGHAIYTGGDDVLALLPLSRSLPTAQRLAREFARTIAERTVSGGTVSAGSVSAGIAMVHRLYPLDAALQAAREGEAAAKRVDHNGRKNAVCVRVLKRSGAPRIMLSHWDDLSDDHGVLFDALRAWFASRALSSRFAYEAEHNLRAMMLDETMEGEASGSGGAEKASPEKDCARELAGAHKLEPPRSEMVCSELKRLIRRHRDDKIPEAPDPAITAERLTEWAQKLPGGVRDLVKWVLLARLLAQGGAE